MPLLELRAVGKSYPTPRGPHPVLAGIDLVADEGEFVAIVGPSGSGKSTLIALIAGLVAPDAGRILLDGEPVTAPGPDRGVVFQNYSLLPWMTARDNVALAVAAGTPGLPAAEQHARAADLLRRVGLGDAARKRPAELSGGMRQRVAVARALAVNPRLLLLDEPFSALDALTRASLQTELARILEHERKTVVMITNDVEEAILLADRIYPLTPGPAATFGPAVPVRITRPRSRRRLNLDREYQRIRRQLIDFLTAAPPVRGLIQPRAAAR
jgi:nitrate/nitrite transport system ATP-binding protein